MSTHVHNILEAKGNDVVTIRQGATVYDCIETMVKHNVGSIIVLDDDGIAGIFTERDYLRRIALEGRTSKTTVVDDVMTRDVLAVHPNETVRNCMTLMTEAKCRHLPVVNDDGRLVGIISIGDCVKEVSRDALAQVSHLEGYIQTYIMGRYPA